jgi:protein phosphatase
MPDTSPAVMIDYGGVSVVGRGRDTNEDAWTALESVSLFVVADGHGADTTSGRIAADIAVKSFRQSCAVGGGPRLVEPFAAAALDANEKIRRHPGIGATLAGLRIEPPWTVVAAIGDCRAYRYRRGYGADAHGVDLCGGILERLTVEHPFWRRGLGATRYPDIDVTYAPLRSGDLYLLTTDGVTRELDDSMIQTIVGDEQRSLASRCDDLVDAANAKLVADDITAVLVQVI